MEEIIYYYSCEVWGSRETFGNFYEVWVHPTCESYLHFCDVWHHGSISHYCDFREGFGHGTFECPQFRLSIRKMEDVHNLYFF